MHTVARRALSSLLPISRRTLLRLPPRGGSGSAARCFHPSQKTPGNPDDLPPPAADPPSRATAINVGTTQDPAQRTNDNVHVFPEGESIWVTEGMADEVVGESGPSGGSGSSDGRSRARGKPLGPRKRLSPKPKEETFPPPEVPEWFIDRGVRLLEEGTASSADTKATITSSCTEYLPSRLPGAWTTDSPLDIPTDTEFTKDLHAGRRHHQHYYLEENVWREIVATVKGGLLVSKPSSAHSLAAMKSHCVLHSPCRGSVYHLDSVVNKVAEDVGADIVRIDPLDLEEMIGDFVGDSRLAPESPISSFSIRSLGYDTHAPPKESREVEEEEEDSEDDYENEPEQPESPPRKVIHPRWIGPISAQLQQLAASGQSPMFVASISTTNPEGNQAYPEESIDRLVEHENEQKTWAVLEALVSAAQIKRTRSDHPPDSESSESPPKGQVLPTQKTIIHVRDFRELERTSCGQAIIRILYEVVLKRRSQGESIMVVGTTSVEGNLEDYLSKSELRSLQAQSENSFESTILVPPHFLNLRCEKDHPVRFREINFRHLSDLLRRRSGDAGESVSFVIPKDYRIEFDEFDDAIPSCGESVWSFEYVHRVVTFMLGELNGKKEVGFEEAKRAVETLDRSDAVKVEWAAATEHSNEEFDRLMKELDEVEVDEGGQPKEHKRKAKIPKNCNAHEKKLLAGVVDPADIRTGFSSVRAPESTIDSLKTLTSMSLIRPEAFRYGVLATDRIPGLLLYGPPGTGKTLLARAVAKESGATVLEVSGSEIFDMYVGESEKNVRAIFSLAKKLSPCVVFIDEADAIFGSRHSHSTRATHREIINQFLKEWADMQSTVFIMVATNRPFDLDDAVLRRLPRRILVDLPTLDDRYEILKIHLAAEVLAPSVSLRSIATQTNLFSGSDLKNICVSAALACVREENAAAAKAKAEGQTYQFPEKRTLEERHFQKAMGEITASISEDMSSLTAIRKFDEKYGEKLGKKKRTQNWGFGIRDQTDSRGTGRVRAD